MVRLIMGANGAGKTKQLIDLIHNAVEAENGSVVCMEPSADMTYNIKFLQILHISPALSKFLDRNCWRPDAKSNIFDKMQLIAFTVPQNPRKIAVSQAGTSLAIIMGRRSTDRRIYVSLFE